MIHTSDGGFVILDWELALWGDPLYDLVSHLHKMGYLPDEEERMRRSWAARQPPEVLSGWSEDLNRYLRHERVKSAIVDGVRYFQVLAEPDNHAGEGRSADRQPDDKDCVGARGLGR